jgi:hypothetical protein
MERKEVTSTSIKSVGYDPKAQVLEVEFKPKGRLYQYSNVPAKEYEALLKAESKGRYFNRYLKDFYPTKRLDK